MPPHRFDGALQQAQPSGQAQETGAAQRAREISPESVIHHHWQSLNGAPGNPVSGAEQVPNGFRIRYDGGGAIYVKTNLSKPSWVYGAIGEQYNALGGPGSWLGFPTADEAEFADGGRVSTFDRGNIYWWPDVGAVALDEVVVRYTGILCFGETDWDQGSPFDEPYVVLGTMSAQGTTANRSSIYERVKAIQGRAESIEIYRGRPYGVSLTALLMEHDDDNPDRYKESMEGALRTSFVAVTAAVGAIATPLVAAVVGPVLQAVVPAVTDALNGLLNLGDDDLGQQTLVLSAKQMITLAGRAPESVDYGVPSKLQTPLYNGEGSSYKVCFSLAPAS
jgi:hypothetical protein